MYEGFQIHKILLSDSHQLNLLTAFLEQNDLHFETDIETAFGVFDRPDRLLACGCAAGNLLKCFAVHPSLRGQNALGELVSSLMQDRFESGYYELMVITRSHNRLLFEQCGMHTVAEAAGVVLLENQSGGPERYAASVLKEHPHPAQTRAGCIVMNCNPFTKGHRYLIQKAAGCCDLLYIFVVETDRSIFSSNDRLRMVQEGCRDIANAVVVKSGPYMISSATFPSYFLKEGEDAAALQSALDITLFAQRLAPPLCICRRFAGEEPADPVTARYNEAMRSILPQYGIAFIEIPRLSDASGGVISASRVRTLLRTQGLTQEVLDLVPETTAVYLRGRCGEKS